MKDHIKQVLISMKAEFSDEVVEMLVLRAKRYQDIRSEIDLAHVIARNWAIGQRRKITNAIKRAEQDRVKQAAFDLERALFEKAVSDFDQLVPTLKSRRTCMPQALRYMRFACIEGKSDPECAEYFPGTTRDQRYQWLKRARDLVLPHASPELKSVLWQNLGTKRKSI